MEMKVTAVPVLAGQQRDGKVKFSRAEKTIRGKPDLTFELLVSLEGM